MDKILIAIKEELQRVTHTGERDRYPVMTGKVVSVDTDNMQVDVALNVDVTDGSGSVSGNKTANLDVAIQNAGGVYVLPTVGAWCLVCEVDGSGGWELLKASAYDTIVMQAATLIRLNDGSLGGLPILSKIQDNLKAIHDYIFNTLQPAIGNAIAAVGVGSAANGPVAVSGTWTPAITGQDIAFEDMENKNIKQG
jgi:hypothetical protein